MTQYWTYLVDGSILTGIALGFIGAFLIGAVVFARMLQAFGVWTNRNAR